MLLAPTERPLRGGPESGVIAISTALLLPHDRIQRAPLPSWAERLSSDFVQNLRGARTVRELCGAVAANANNTALVATHQGARSVARTLCELQLRWHHRMSRRSRDKAVAARMVQPWVNLARLDAMSGNWEVALTRLAALPRYRSTGRIELGTRSVPECGWQAVAATRPDFEDSLDCVYVIDSLKVLLLTGRFQEAIAFASSLGTGFRRGLLEFGMEASIVAKCRLGDAAGARQIALDARAGARGWERVVFTIRLAEAVALEGDHDAAREILAPILGVMGRVSPEKKGELQTLYVLHRLSTLCREIGLEEEALSLAEEVYRGARAAGDEVFEIESLRTLSAASSGRGHKRWEETLDQLQQTTLYQRYRRGEQREVRSPVLDRTYAQLTEFLAV